MTLSQKRNLKKEFFPDYYKKFNVLANVILLGVLFLGLSAVIAAAMIGDEAGAVITLGVYCLVVIAVCIAIAILRIRMQKRLIQQRTQEIESQFVDLPFEDVTATLLNKRVISEYGFLANVGDYAGKLMVPFNEATVSLYSANIYTKICSLAVITNDMGTDVAEHLIDNLLLNYICKKGIKLNFVGNSRLLVYDKEAFVRAHIIYDSDKRVLTSRLGPPGTMISDAMGDPNRTRRMILRVLCREMH